MPRSLILNFPARPILRREAHADHIADLHVEPGQIEHKLPLLPPHIADSHDRQFQRRLGIDLHDGAASLRNHDPGGRLRAEKIAEQVDRNDGLPVACRDFGDVATLQDS